LNVESSSDEQIVVFDGVCNLCSRSAHFILRNDRSRVFKLATAQSAIGRQLLADAGIDPDNVETFVLVRAGHAYFRSDAALEVVNKLDWPWRALKILRFIPRALRDPVYRLVARNRYRWFGRKATCMVPTNDIRSRFLE